MTNINSVTSSSSSYSSNSSSSSNHQILGAMNRAFSLAFFISLYSCLMYFGALGYLSSVLDLRMIYVTGAMLVLSTAINLFGVMATYWGRAGGLKAMRFLFGLLAVCLVVWVACALLLVQRETFCPNLATALEGAFLGDNYTDDGFWLITTTTSTPPSSNLHIAVDTLCQDRFVAFYTFPVLVCFILNLYYLEFASYDYYRGGKKVVAGEKGGDSKIQRT